MDRLRRNTPVSNLQMDRDHKKALKQVMGGYVLPSFPSITMMVLERIRNEDSSVASVVEALSLDPGLSVRVLATANSAGFASRHRADDLTQAVAILSDMLMLPSIVPRHESTVAVKQ